MIVLGMHICGIGSKFQLIPTWPGGKTSKSCHTQFLVIFAHNVNFPGKLEKCKGILFSQNGSVMCTHLCGIGPKFPLIAT